MVRLIHLVFLVQLRDQIANNSCHLRLILLRQLLHKLHAVPFPCLLVRLLQVVLDVLLRIVLKLVNVFLRQRNIRQYDDLEQQSQVLLDELRVVADVSALPDVLY